MLIEGVNFIVRVCVKMSKDEFIKRHQDSVWQDRDRKKRYKMLSDAYDIINPPKKVENTEAASE